MELSFVASALRRYWWLFVGSMLVCIAVGAYLRGGTQTAYESKALLSIAPPSASPGGGDSSSDRYVTGQLLVLGSESSAATVADAVGGGATAESVLAMLTVVQAPSSDIVELTISTDDPKRSQEIATAYLQQYFARLQLQIDDTHNASLSGIDEQLNDLQASLTSIDTQIADAMEPYLPKESCANSCPPIPPIEQVVPDLVSQKQMVLAQFTSVSATKTELEVRSQLQVGSQIVQAPTLPTSPVVSSNRKILIAGALAGMFLGVLLSVIAARVSRHVLDDAEAAEIVGQPLVGAMPKYQVSLDRRAFVEYLPVEVSPFIDHLRVRADAIDRRHRALVVAVTGTEMSVGTTAIAGALANRFAVNGAEVIIVDADPLHPELSELFELDPDRAVSGKLDGVDPLDRRKADGGAQDARAVALNQRGAVPSLLRRTRVSGLSILAGGDLVKGSVLRREDAVRVVSLLDGLADVIIIDGGPFLGAASTVQFTHIADAAVLVIPQRRQTKQALALIAGQLREQQPNVLAISTPAATHPRQ